MASRLNDYIGDHWIRALLLAATFCWGLLAVGNLVVSDDQRWYPDIVGIFSGVTGVCVFGLAVAPRTVLAYRAGGTLAVGTLVLRCASILEGQAQGTGGDTVWLGMAAVGITAMLTFCYGRWWLTDVKLWHETHKRVGR